MLIVNAFAGLARLVDEERLGALPALVSSRLGAL
jgi:hypothetical protein